LFTNKCIWAATVSVSGNVYYYSLVNNFRDYTRRIHIIFWTFYQYLDNSVTIILLYSGIFDTLGIIEWIFSVSWDNTICISTYIHALKNVWIYVWARVHVFAQVYTIIKNIFRKMSSSCFHKLNRARWCVDDQLKNKKTDSY